MGAVGGYGFGGSQTAERQAAVPRQWKSGRGDVEFVNGHLAWLAMIERAQLVFDSGTGEQRWDLRVTEIFRRVGRDLDGAIDMLIRWSIDGPLVKAPRCCSRDGT